MSLSQSFSLSIKDGRYLPFTACAAHAIVCYRVLHLRGWTASDNPDEFDSFNSKHKKRFEEFSQNSSSGILSQLWQKLSGSYRNPSRIFTLSVLLGTLEMSLIV
jgi:hypothetical protein